MFQKNVLVSGIDELKQKLPEIQGAFSAVNYIDGVIDIEVGNTPEDELAEILALLKEEFPRLKITGMSGGSILIFSQGKSKVIALNFTLMTESHAQLFSRKFERTSENLVEECVAYAKEVREEIKKLKDIKGISIYFAWLKASASSFISILSDGLEDVPIFGAIASANSHRLLRNYITVDNEDTIVISDDWVGPGVSIAVYSGEDLYVYSEYIFGWEPIGRYLDICACEVSHQGSTTIWSIDGKKPTDVYYKYLGVTPNEAFVSNISEFPLIVERDGVYIGRTPSGYGDKGEVYLEGDILEGEKVRFSYGERDDILSGTKDAADRMRAFGAESLSLIVCGNRFGFLQEDYHLEVDYYTEGRYERPAIYLGMGEIYRYKGKGGVLNSALVAVGMREGLGGETYGEVMAPHAAHSHEGIVPLAERLSHFLKAMTGELVMAVKDAKAANEAKSTFLSNMSHEIRTPINAVLGMDEMILRECEDAQILEYAQNIKTAGNTLLSLINDILDFSKIEAGKMDIIPVDYDFSSVINDLVNMIKPRAEAKNLEFIAEVAPHIPSVLNGDEIRIKQVVTNILTNAVKYTEKGSVTLKIECHRCTDDSVELKVSVIDTGIGIKDADYDRMFSAFQRVDEERNRNIEGTGLGLNITRQLLKLMGSSLEIDSEYGKGSDFHFIIRQSVVKWEPIGDYMETFRRALETREKYHEKFIAPEALVLVVDDTPMNLTVFEGLLKKTLVKIDKASSGMECLEKSRKKKYDMIFLDHRMPEMDGIETLKRLKSEEDNPNKDAVAISLTANAVSGAREQYIEAGFDDYLTKPIMSDKLETLLMQYLPAEKIKESEGAEDNEETGADENIPEWIIGIQNLDNRLGIENCGSIETYISAVESFADAAEENYRTIKDFFENEDIAEYTIRVHALKSSARIIGAIALSELAADLEKAGDARDIATIKADTPRLLELYRLLFESLLEKRSKIGENIENLPPMAKADLLDAMNSIKELAANFDYDSIKYIMDTIGGYMIPNDERERISDLKRAVMQADWDEIKKVLERK